MVTRQGVVKKTSLEAYSRPRTNGVNAINIREDDELLEAVLTNGRCIIMIAAQAYTSVQEHPLVAEDMQKAIRFGAELTRMLIENEHK